MPRLIWVFAKRTAPLLVLSCRGSYHFRPLCRLMHDEPPHDKTNKMARAPSEDSDQPGHSLIRVFAVRMKKHWVLSYQLSALPRLWSDGADTQAELSLRWAHSHFVYFVMRRLNGFTTAFSSPLRLSTIPSLNFLSYPSLSICRLAFVNIMSAFIEIPKTW